MIDTLGVKTLEAFRVVQAAHLKENDKSKSHRGNEPELVGQTVVLMASVVFEAGRENKQRVLESCCPCLLLLYMAG